MKNFVIFGDSYSTHKDHIPNGYAFYYSDEGDFRSVTKMTWNQTWWGRIVENSDAKLIANNSWSGSTIGYTGYGGYDAVPSSFITRYRMLYDAGFFTDNDIDTVLVFGGTNDSWSNAPLGEEKYSDWQEEDFYFVMPAICYLMSRLKQDLPDTRIVFIANCDIKDEVVECMRNASKRIGAELIELKNIDKEEGHPNVSGMKQIYEQVSAKL